MPAATEVNQVLDGRLLVDAHVHVARLPTLSADWHSWARDFGRGVPVAELFDHDGVPRPAALDAHFAAEGADHVLLFSEYSPKATGIQPIEDLLPLARYNPARFRPVASINPHLHYPVKAEPASSAWAPWPARSIRSMAGSRRPTPCSTRPTRPARNGACR
jgi:hypothetical protein